MKLPWWRHHMETFSASLALSAGNSPVTGEFPARRPVTRNLMLSLICAWIKKWVSNREAGDLRHHRAHYDIIVMRIQCIIVNIHDPYGWAGWAPLTPDSVLTLQWRHNGHDGVSNHHPHDCLLSRLLRRRSKKISKLRVTGLVWGIPRTKGQ